MPSSAATSTAQDVIGLANDARRNVRAVSPCVDAMVDNPELCWMTVAETLSTGQSAQRSRAVIERAVANSGEVLDQFGDPERQVDTLPGIESWIAHGLVPAVEVGIK